MRTALLALLVTILFALHQDVWFWRAAAPLVFEFIPAGLFYHACYSVAASVLMWVLVKYAWPSHLEQQVAQDGITDADAGETDAARESISPDNNAREGEAR